ncbi:unnamed protein product, partial [Polarella glacialis]
MRSAAKLETMMRRLTINPAMSQQEDSFPAGSKTLPMTAQETKQSDSTLPTSEPSPQCIAHQEVAPKCCAIGRSPGNVKRPEDAFLRGLRSMQATLKAMSRESRREAIGQLSAALRAKLLRFMEEERADEPV